MQAQTLICRKPTPGGDTVILSNSLLFMALALPVCLAIIVLSAGYFVRGAVSLAHRLSVPEFIVGSIIVAIGTSAPEMAINVFAALEQAGDIVISNIIGSNIVNIALGIGLAACMMSFDRARREYIRTILIGGLGAIAVLAVTLCTAGDGGMSFFSRGVGILLLGAFALFMWHSIRTANGDDDEEMSPDVSLPVAILLVVLGALSMAFFSDQAVLYAIGLSERIGIPEAVVGATVIAAGGSLPEISACVAAARIGRPNLVLGNIAGSQIFNVLGILGLSGLITGFSFSTVLWIDMAVLLVMTAVLLVCIRFARIRLVMGPVLLVCYGLYAVYLVVLSTGG